MGLPRCFPQSRPASTAVAVANNDIDGDQVHIESSLAPFANKEAATAWAFYHSSFVSRDVLPMFLHQYHEGYGKWETLGPELERAQY